MPPKKKSKPLWLPDGIDSKGDSFTVTQYAKNVGDKYTKCADDEEGAKKYTANVRVEILSPLTLKCTSEECAAGESKKTFGQYGCYENHIQTHIVKWHTPQKVKRKVRLLACLCMFFFLLFTLY